MKKDSEGNVSPHQHKRTLNRRHLLGGATVAAGAGVVAWRAFGDDGEQQLDGGQVEPTTSPSTTPSAPTEEPSPAAVHIVGVVGDEGFDIRLGAVRVSAPAGVAAPGASIGVSLPIEPAPPEISSLATNLGQPVSILLGNGQQPKQPVLIVFDLRETDLAASVSETMRPTVMSWSGTADSIALTTGEWDAQNQTLTATTDHLTSFWPALVDIGAYIKDTVEGFLGLKFSKPACAFDPLTIGSTRYSISHSGEDPIWPCLVNDNGRLAVDLHSNSNMAWAVKSRPSTTGRISGGWKDLGPGLAAIYQGIFEVLGENRSAVMPGGSIRLPFDPKAGEVRIEVRQSPVLFDIAMVLQAVISVLDALPTGRMADAVLESFSALDCITEVINTFYQEESADIARSVVTSTLSCVAAMITEQKGSRLNFAASTALAVVGMLSAAANSLIGAIQGIYRELTGSALAAYTIAATVTETPTLPATPVGAKEASSWPTTRHDNRSALYTRLGVNMYNIPSWSACDDAGSWCLAGYSDGTPSGVPNELVRVSWRGRGFCG